MTSLICYHCFTRFQPYELHFRCLHHKHNFPVLSEGVSGVKQFWLRHFQRTPVVSARCNFGKESSRCRLLSGYRVCPHCEEPLPHYLGRIPQRIVAVTGCGASGKTVYLSCLLWQLRHQHALSQSPFVTAMFEDDRSFRFYQKLYHDLFVQRWMPRFTQAADQKEGNLPPVIVRLLRSQGDSGYANLVFYDHAGELIEALELTRYLRYLAHSQAILYLVDPRESQDLAATGLQAVARQIRIECGLKQDQPIEKPLAVVLTKMDSLQDPIFREPATLRPDTHDPAEFWNRWGRHEQAAIHKAGRRIEEYLRNEKKFDNLANAAELNFPNRQYFVVSSLGQEPDSESKLAQVPQPMGVESPLFWALRSLRS